MIGGIWHRCQLPQYRPGGWPDCTSPNGDVRPGGWPWPRRRPAGGRPAVRKALREADGRVSVARCRPTGQACRLPALPARCHPTDHACRLTDQPARCRPTGQARFVRDHAGLSCRNRTAEKQEANSAKCVRTSRVVSAIDADAAEGATGVPSSPSPGMAGTGWPRKADQVASRPVTPPENAWQFCGGACGAGRAVFLSELAP